MGYPLPITVIAEMLGVRPRDMDQFEEWSHALALRPREDLVSHEELLSVMLLILVAGNETTRNPIGNGMLALLRNPKQLQRLRAAPELLGSAVWRRPGGPRRPCRGRTVSVPAVAS